MQMYDINNKLVNVDVRPSQYPRRRVSKSKLQTITGAKLDELYPYQIILEEFYVPGSKLSVDFFLPKIGLVVEVQGEAHYEHIPFFHGDRKTSTKFAGQIRRDMKKVSWCQYNGYELIEIVTEKDLENLNVPK